MIISPPIDNLNAFNDLCIETTKYLNSIANKHQFQGGTRLEPDVFNAAQKTAIGSPFENKLFLISGHRFPDIQVGDNFGIEVKSSRDGWSTVGSSVMEGSRIQSIERIFLIYGKLSDPVEFRTRPYEDCLSDIVVTHSPRYHINMELSEDETIFHKMNQEYDSFRKLDNPIAPFIQYKRSQETDSHYWWLPEESVEETASPAQIQFFSQLNKEQKDFRTAEAMLLYPIIFSNDPKKYNPVATYWITKWSLLCTNIRDIFSAGGRVELVPEGANALPFTVSKIVKNLYEARMPIRRLLKERNRNDLLRTWNVSTQTNQPIETIWRDLVLENSAKSKDIGMSRMMTYFFRD